VSIDVTQNDEPSSDRVRAQLASVLASDLFSSALRPRRFLSYVVEQTLAGKQESIKESVLGCQVFDRPPGYDPRADGIVRVEATKLRARLGDYYAGPGKLDPVRIEIPKGTYVPRFTSQPEGAPVEVPSTRRSRHLVIWATVLAGLLIAALWLTPRLLKLGGDAKQDIPTIAVLPFLDLSPDAKSEYFSDGLTEQLTDILAQVDNLHVASRTSAFAFKGKPADAKEIGAKLRVGAILEGSVRRSGDQLRITAQLIRTSDGYHVWSKTFDRVLKDVFAVQEEISAQIAHSLKVTIDDDAKRRLFNRYTQSVDAFDLYLQGRHLLNTIQPDAPDRATELFEKALAIDPRFAMAYVGIATAAVQTIFTDIRPPALVVKQMKNAAERALALDPSLAEAQAILADVAGRFEWNWPLADRLYKHAIELNPNSPDVHMGYALNVLLPLRRQREAYGECAKAVQLDGVTTQWKLCRPWVLLSENPEAAVAEYKQLIATEPDYPGYSGALAIAYLASGKFREAIDMLEPFHADRTPGGSGFLGYAYGRSGRTADALRMERVLKSAPFVSPGALTLVYLGLNRIPEARAAAETQIQQHSGNAYLMVFSPMFEPLRRDHEFAKELKTLGLAF